MTNQQKDKIIALRSQGFGYATIAQRLWDCRKALLSHIVEKHGLPSLYHRIARTQARAASSARRERCYPSTEATGLIPTSFVRK